MQAALDDLWPYTGEMFHYGRCIDSELAAAGDRAGAGLAEADVGADRAHHADGGDAAAPARHFRAQGRQARHPHGASRLHPGRDAVPAARLSGGDVVSPGRRRSGTGWVRFRTRRSRSFRSSIWGSSAMSGWDDDTLVVTVTPTYSGLPGDSGDQSRYRNGAARSTASRSCAGTPPVAALDDGLDQRRGPREACSAYGIAPPVARCAGRLPALRIDADREDQPVRLHALQGAYRCTDCLEPFDYFKCI